MNKFCLALLGIVALTLGSAQAYEKSEYKVRPWEIINGLQPYSEQLWQTDADGIAGWKATNGGVLSETSLTKLWGEKVAKLTFPKGGSVTINVYPSAGMDEKTLAREIQQIYVNAARDRRLLNA